MVPLPVGIDLSVRRFLRQADGGERTGVDQDVELLIAQRGHCCGEKKFQGGVRQISLPTLFSTHLLPTTMSNNAENQKIQEEDDDEPDDWLVWRYSVCLAVLTREGINGSSALAAQVVLQRMLNA